MVRIYEFLGLSLERASNQEVVIVYSSRPRQILFSRQITFFLLFPPRRLDCLFVSTPYHFPLCRLFIISPRLHPPFPLSTTQRFLRQVLCTYINSSSVSLRVPRHSFRGNRLVTRLRRAKQSSKHGETFVLVETRRISSLCTPLLLPARDLPGRNRPRAETESVSATWSHTTCGFLWDKGPLDNRGYFKEGSPSVWPKKAA